MNRLVLTIAILLGLAAPAWAGFAEGFAAYERGDYATALREFRPLAEQGVAEAQFNLGFAYEKGEGVPQDYVHAHMWLNLGASRLPPGTKHTRAVNNRDILAEKMTPAQIAEAQRLAREWKPKKEGE